MRPIPLSQIGGPARAQERAARRRGDPLIWLVYGAYGTVDQDRRLGWVATREAAEALERVMARPPGQAQHHVYRVVLWE